VTEKCKDAPVARVEEQCEWFTEECTTSCPSSRQKRGVVQAVLLASALASQNGGEEEPKPQIRCYYHPHTYCRENFLTDNTCYTNHYRRCYHSRSKRSAEEESCPTTLHTTCTRRPATEGQGRKACAKVEVTEVKSTCTKVANKVCS